MRADFSQVRLSGLQNPSSSGNPGATYVIVKLAPIISYMFFGGFDGIFSVSFISTLILLIADFVTMITISGLQMVGLKWFFNWKTGKMDFYSKPEPFIPSIGLSNLFWIGFFISSIFWMISIVISLAKHHTLRSLTSVTGFVSQAWNLFMYATAHMEAKRRVERAVLNSMNDGVHFDAITEEVGESQSDEQIEKPVKEETTAVDLPPPLQPKEDV